MWQKVWRSLFRKPWALLPKVLQCVTYHPVVRIWDLKMSEAAVGAEEPVHSVPLTSAGAVVCRHPMWISIQMVFYVLGELNTFAYFKRHALAEAKRLFALSTCFPGYPCSQGWYYKLTGWSTFKTLFLLLPTCFSLQSLTQARKQP